MRNIIVTFESGSVVVCDPRTVWVSRDGQMHVGLAPIVRVDMYCPGMLMGYGNIPA